MRFIYSILLISILLAGGVACQKAISASAPSVANTDSSRISLEDAKKDFDNQAAIFVDSRPEGSYKYEHIKDAINIPLAEADKHLKELPTNRKIIVYCS